MKKVTFKTKYHRTNSKPFYKSKVISLWLVSYLMIFIILLTNSIINSAISKVYMKRSADSYTEMIFYNIRRNCEAALYSFTEVYNTIITGDEIKRLLNETSERAYFTNADTQIIADRMRPRSNEKINYFIYIGKTDTVISHNGIYSSKEYFNSLLRDYDMSYDQWLKAISSGTAPSMTQLSRGSEKSIFVNVKYSVPYKGTVCISGIFPNDTLFGTDYMPDWGKECDIYICNAQGEIIICTNHSGVPVLKFSNEIRENYPSSWALYETKMDFFSSMAKIIVAYPKNTVSSVRTLTTISWSLTLISMIMSILCMVFSIRRNYRPFEHMLKMFGISNSTNEIIDIRTNINRLLQENQLYSQTAENTAKSIRHMVLTKCMKHGYSPEYILKLLEKEKISFPHSKLILVGYNVDDINALFGGIYSLPVETGRSELTYIIDNISAELMEKISCSCETISVDENIISIISTDNPDVYDNELPDMLDCMIDIIQNEFEVKISYTLSGVRPGFGNLSAAYVTVAYLLRYQSVMDIDYPIDMSDINNGSTEMLCSIFDLATEQKLINCISIGESDKAIMIVEKIFDDMSASKYTAEQMQCLMFDIACSLRKVPLIGEGDARIIDYSQMMLCSESKKQMLAFLRSAISKLCDGRISTTGSASKSQKSESVMEYIKNNYLLSQLNLDYVANEFDIYPGYLSKQFKDKYNISIPEYINKLRIEHAKELLQTTDKTIESIALESGFGSLRTFNRIYKMVEGISPSKYRNSLK